MEQEELNTEIVSRVRQEWSERHLPVLLATLGSAHDNKIAAAAKRFAVSLSDYVEANLQGQVRLIRHTVKRPLVGVIPCVPDADSVADTDAILEHAVSSKRIERKTRYMREFWFAFQTPIPLGCRRYVVDGDPPEIIDLAAAEAPSPAAKEITQDYVLAPEHRGDIACVHAMIDRWLQATGSSSEKYALTLLAANARSASGSDGSASLLAAVLHALSEDQLKRVSMPLDVVAALYRRKLR